MYIYQLPLRYVIWLLRPMVERRENPESTNNWQKSFITIDWESSIKCKFAPRHATWFITSLESMTEKEMLLFTFWVKALIGKMCVCVCVFPWAWLYKQHLIYNLTTTTCVCNWRDLTYGDFTPTPTFCLAWNVNFSVKFISYIFVDLKLPQCTASKFIYFTHYLPS